MAKSRFVSFEVPPRLRAECLKDKFDSNGFIPVSAALSEYVRRHRQDRIEDLYGAIEYPADWNPRAMRRSR